MKKAVLFQLVLFVAIAGCGPLPEKISSDDPRLKPMLEAMARVERQGYGFTPLSRDATIRLELGPRDGYDVMLHVDGKTSRTIAVRSRGPGYEWIGEQETYGSRISARAASAARPIA